MQIAHQADNVTELSRVEVCGFLQCAGHAGASLPDCSGYLQAAGSAAGFQSKQPAASGNTPEQASRTPAHRAHLPGPEDGGYYQHNLPRPLQHPFLPGLRRISQHTLTAHITNALHHACLNLYPAEHPQHHACQCRCCVCVSSSLAGSRQHLHQPLLNGAMRIRRLDLGFQLDDLTFH